MSLSLQTVSDAIQAQFIGRDSQCTIDHVSIDSRSMQNGPNSLFFALVGPNYNAHNFISEMIEKGVRCFVVSELPENIDKKANYLLVNDTLKALQQFAGFYRSQYHFPIIGITGSNGKTIVKEWLNFLLSPDYNIIRSPKSYNSQVGVSLSVIAINEKHNLGIFEAGISTVGEMENLENIIKPNIGILTNIGSTHDEGFPDRETKIREKLKLFENADLLIYHKTKDVSSIINPKTNTFSWSFEDKTSDVFISKITLGDQTLLNVCYQEKNFEIKIPFQDDASIENAIPCLLILLHFGYEAETIASRMTMLFPVEMRLKVKNGINNTTLIDDSYSADFQSLKIALDYLENQKHHKKRTIILSDILQSGFSNEKLYAKIAKLVNFNKIDRIIGVGNTISEFESCFPNGIFYKNTDEFINSFEELNFENETILIKGARVFEFEKIVTLLEEKTHETVLEINLNALSHNLNHFKSKLKLNTKLMAMVKAFGYGSGGFEIAQLLEYHKVDYLGVAFADEGISLKNGGITLPIMVLNPETTSFSAIIQHGLEPEIYSLKGLNAFLKIAEQKQISRYPIHIKLDTGMHRLGFEDDNINELIAILKQTDKVSVKSILSHMATSDDLEEDTFSRSQIQLFEDLSSQMMTELNIKPLRHLLNTSGIENYPEAQYDMVRLGIGLYGVSNNPKEQIHLENVGTLKSVISQIRTIDVGESVGYGRRFIAQKTSQIATIPIGYADGINRAWGNERGYVTIKGQKAPIIGSICMDMLMVDITEINCNEGDQVIIFGKDPTVIQMAQCLKTIPYEILTGISQRVKRVFYRE